jgi:acetate kinase
MEHNDILAFGLVEKIGEEKGHLTYEPKNKPAYEEHRHLKNHQEALEKVTSLLLDTEKGVIKNVNEVQAIGHRVVHGGENFKTPSLVNQDVLSSIEKMIPLAPLHNPPNLQGLKVAMGLFPKVPQVAVFDTAFHQTMPDYAFRYALPENLYEQHGLRRYGFHGTSHHYISKKYCSYLNKNIDSFNGITLHLGNGCSMAAIKNGKSMDTTMGMTPLEGLVMGTRCGDIDPAIPFFLSNQLNMPLKEIDVLLNKKSGLKGLCQKNDVRDIITLKEKGDKSALLALKIYTYRIKKYIGAYSALLGPIDAILFTAGVGENSPLIREMALQDLNHLGIALDKEKNEAAQRGTVCEIQEDGQKIKILIIPTDEEREIAEQTKEILSNKNLT